ncbi:YdiU family protein [Salipiger sp. IMCC34102]|uniref:protein adenylyltransferase SelO n=1 Tax=Salipiger sp. IMCC34102 TaxID=2510647 RepID=UPI00101C9CDF|nr:YdiU family protein [Salipiger sp. IMCC34102]RYH03355.1 YdiU family protein [Salipiger sp. IMCC34102]
MIAFDNSFARLPERFYTRLDPTPVATAETIVVNDALATALGLDRDWLNGPQAVQVFAGNAVPDGAEPLAQLYGGHQFGSWSGQLGDGRAILLGEVRAEDGALRDIQLKGAGRTPYSRGGDGRAWLGPVLREYLVSEAMHAMGVPTTRALAAVTTGEQVARETLLPGAILTRVARSHIRVGTFQIHTARQDVEALRTLTDYTIARHWPDADGPAGLLDAVVAAQAELIAQWMGLGFIHGVMNTDNCSLAGETIDYGPCAFLDTYDPQKVFSSIDRMGRYAYANQPGIAIWNLAQLATALIPLMPDEEAAVADFTTRINRFADLYQAAWVRVFGAKLGLADPTLEDADLIQRLLTLMAGEALDFTATFTRLGMGEMPPALSAWAAEWQRRRAGDWTDRMARANPTVIPRNHRVEAVIAAATRGDFAPFHEMLKIATRPFDPLDETRAPYALPPEPTEVVRQTFCGT